MSQVVLQVTASKIPETEITFHQKNQLKPSFHVDLCYRIHFCSKMPLNQYVWSHGLGCYTYQHYDNEENAPLCCMRRNRERAVSWLSSQQHTARRIQGHGWDLEVQWVWSVFICHQPAGVEGGVIIRLHCLSIWLNGGNVQPCYSN